MGEYERLLDQALDYYLWAERFGWTSRQVDDEPAWLLDRYAVIADAQAEARSREARRQAAADRAATRQRGR